jgi:hypothetical protein
VDTPKKTAANVKIKGIAGRSLKKPIIAGNTEA